MTGWDGGGGGGVDNIFEKKNETNVFEKNVIDYGEKNVISIVVYHLAFLANHKKHNTKIYYIKTQNTWRRKLRRKNYSGNIYGELLKKVFCFFTK